MPVVRSRPNLRCRERTPHHSSQHLLVTRGAPPSATARVVCDPYAALVAEPTAHGFEATIEKPQPAELAMDFAARGPGNTSRLEQHDRVELNLMLPRDREPNRADQAIQVGLGMRLHLLHHDDAFRTRDLNREGRAVAGV